MAGRWVVIPQSFAGWLSSVASVRTRHRRCLSGEGPQQVGDSRQSLAGSLSRAASARTRVGIPGRLRVRLTVCQGLSVLRLVDRACAEG